MTCSKCASENPADALFCEKCGAKLERVCPFCGAAVSPDAQFCRRCGQGLSSRPSVAAAPSATPHASVRVVAEQPVADVIEGERKTVTALFADIKGSMELMEDLDPEEARAIVDPALRLMMDAVHRYDGYIVQSTGDGIFALFGAPVAHEDHPQRALYAALRMQEDMRRYSAKLRVAGNPPVEARVGVNTGEVVVRSIATGEGHAEYTPVGHSTGLAARMQALAPTGSVAATEQVRRLCEGYFVFKDLGPTSIKGVAGQVNVFEVVELGPLRTRLQVSAQRGLTKFVGRQSELEQMKRALELARAGHGQMVAAIGEPGVGKSRLFFEFKAAAQSGSLVLEAYSVSHGKVSAYLPVIELLKNYFKISVEDDDRARREKVAGKIVMLDPALEDTLAYLFGLLGIVEGKDPLAQLDPPLRRRRTLDAVKRILARESLNQPLIVILEDLHWIDSETQALLNMIVDGLATARILLLVNYRPEYHHQWGNKTYYTQLRLDPLGRESADEMLAALLGEGVELAPIKQLIVERTEGIPFFMEEMVRALFEAGVVVRNGAVKLAKPLKDIRVPVTVQAILASRIDRLPAEEKELLQTLAVLGRDFQLGLIKQVSGRADGDLERMLSHLQLAEFIYEQPAFPDVEYTFKHPLTQEVAYNSILVERRRMLHERAGSAIEALFADRLEDHLGELAHHYDRSANVLKAVEYLRRAGVRATQQVAHPEAIGYFLRALELIKRLPEGIHRDRGELDLQMSLSWSSYVAWGPAAPEREPILIRAKELCERLGDNAQLMEALLALGFFRHLHGDGAIAQELDKKVIQLAEAPPVPSMLARASSQLALHLFNFGKFEEARRLFEKAVELFGSGPLHNFRDSYYAHLATGMLSHVVLYLGYPEQAFAKLREARAAAHRQADTFSMLATFFTEAMTYLVLRDSEAAAERAEELLPIAIGHGMLPHQQAQVAFFRGLAMADAGRAEEGLAEMRSSLAEAETLDPVIRPILAAFAEVCGKNGLAEEGLQAVGRGLSSEGHTETEAELHRVRGELLLVRKPSADAEAENCFRTAIDIARQQNGKWWELRATTSLARLLKRQGKPDEARAMVTEIYNWFTEGFDTADMKDAKALLDELDGRTVP